MTREQPPTLVPASKLPFRVGFDLLFPFLYALAYTVLGIFLQLRFFPIGDIDLETDFYGDLVIAARHLAAGRFSVQDFAWKGPVYALALVPAHWIAGDWYRGAVVLSALAGGAFLLLAYRLMLRLFDRRVALLSMITTSLVVEFFVQFHRASTDVLFLSLTLGSIGCSVLAGGSLRRHAAAGGLAALAFMTRYNGIFLVGGEALILAFANLDGLARSRRMKAGALYLGAFLLVCSPWFVACWMETGRILATRNAENVVAAFYGGSRWQSDPALQGLSLPALVGRDPAYFAARYGLHLVEHAQKNLSQLLGWPMALLPIAGILGFAIRPPTRRQTALYLFAVAYWLLMGIVFYAPRFFLPMILPCVAAGCSIWQSEERGGSGPRRWLQLPGRWRHADDRWLRATARRWMAFSILAAFMLVLTLVQVRRIAAVERTIYARRPLYILDAARALAPAAPASRPRMLARKGHLAYYAGFDFSPYSIRVGSLEELVRYARSVSAEYIVYSQVEYSMLPRMLFLAVADTVPLLQEVYRGRSIRVFHLTEDTRTVLSDAERTALLLANLSAARTQGRPAALFIATYDLGRHYMQTQQFAEAARMLQWAIEVAQGPGGDPEMKELAASVRYHLAGAQLELRHPETAIHILQENLEYWETRGAPRAMAARTHQRLGRAYTMMGRDEEAHREERLAHELDPAIDAAARPESLRALERPE
jgi:4-amino-4-deoxy-L-arabinose transferase-like glycosyltransferase